MSKSIKISVTVDLGGTWLRVTAREPDKAILWHVRRAAVTADRLPTVLRTIFRCRKIRPDVLLVGARGQWAPRNRKDLRRRLTDLARKVTVISDVELAYLERLGRVPGLLILAGTGSIALARDDRGRWHRAGGLGPKLGDEGSGYWIGKEYRRRALGQESGTTPSDVRRVAAQTPVVFQRAAKKDPLCTAVIKDAVQHLAEIGRQAAHAAKLPTPWKIVWAGGLMDIPTFRRAVRRALAAREKRGHT